MTWIDPLVTPPIDNQRVLAKRADGVVEIMVYCKPIMNPYGDNEWADAKQIRHRLDYVLYWDFLDVTPTATSPYQWIQLNGFPVPEDIRVIISDVSNYQEICRMIKLVRLDYYGNEYVEHRFIDDIGFVYPTQMVAYWRNIPNN
jgi:hypothetical protein